MGGENLGDVDVVVERPVGGAVVILAAVIVQARHPSSPLLAVCLESSLLQWWGLGTQRLGPFALLACLRVWAGESSRGIFDLGAPLAPAPRRPKSPLLVVVGRPLSIPPSCSFIQNLYTRPVYAVPTCHVVCSFVHLRNRPALEVYKSSIWIRSLTTFDFCSVMHMESEDRWTNVCIATIGAVRLRF
jgi:hypothetical protein